jgi:hypothetical protein
MQPVRIRRGYRIWAAYVAFLSVVAAILVTLAGGIAGLIVALLLLGPLSTCAAAVRRCEVSRRGAGIVVRNPFRTYECELRDLETLTAHQGWNLGLSTLAFSYFLRRRTWAVRTASDRRFVLYVFNEYGVVGDELSGLATSSLDSWLAEVARQR